MLPKLHKLEFVSFTKDLNIVRSPSPDAHAKDDTNVDTTKGVAGVEEWSWNDSDQGENHLSYNKDHLCLQGFGVEDFIFLKDANTSRNFSHKNVHPVLLVSCKMPECGNH